MAADFTIRVAAPEDATAASELFAASYPQLMAPAYEPAVLAAALPAMIQANPALLATGTYFVAETGDGVIVGCGGWTREQPQTGEVKPGLGHIRHFGTHHEWVGRGIGRAIYERCEQQARSAGIQRFECCASLNAEGFYAAMGFKAVRRIEVAMPENAMLPAVLMKRPL